MEIKENIELKNYTTYKIGGRAKYFCVVKNAKDLIEAIDFAKNKKVKIFILGGGSNILFSDKGFGGLVIKLQICKAYKLENKENEIFAGAGTSFTQVIKLALENSLSGVEWAVGIPHMTVGGAVYGNAQAFGSKTSMIINNVEVLDTKTFKIKNFNQAQCKFSLKNSIFKQNKNLIILSVVFVLFKKDSKLINLKIQEFLAHRKKCHPMNYPSAGSVFVNPEKPIKNKKLLKQCPELVVINEKGVIPSGFLIEKCGLRGKKIGKAQISEKHCNFIVNLGGAKANDVVKLINLAKQKVKQKFGVELETEIQIIK